MGKKKEDLLMEKDAPLSIFLLQKEPDSCNLMNCNKDAVPCAGLHLTLQDWVRYSDRSLNRVLNT